MQTAVHGQAFVVCTLYPRNNFIIRLYQYKNLGRPLQLTARAMLRDRCPLCRVCRSCLSVTLVYCGQEANWYGIGSMHRSGSQATLC